MQDSKLWRCPDLLESFTHAPILRFSVVQSHPHPLLLAVCVAAVAKGTLFDELASLLLLVVHSQVGADS